MQGMQYAVSSNDGCRNAVSSNAGDAVAIHDRSWIATASPALLFFAMLSCHLPSPNLLVLYPVTFETALLHALTVTLIVHRGKARYSRFENLSDVSLSRNRCRRVYLDQKPTKLGNLGAP